MQKIVRPYELLFRWNRADNTLTDFTIGGHARLLTEIVDDQDENGNYPILSAKEGDAISLDGESGNAMLQQVLGDVSAALAVSLGAETARSRALELQLAEALAEIARLTSAMRGSSAAGEPE